MEKIFEVLLELTKRCNLRCEHCYIDDKTKKNSEHLPKKRWMEIINKLASMGVEDCVLLGGEPLLHEGFWDILQHSIDNFKNVVVETNGTLFSNFERYDCNVSVSLEYPDKSKNDSIRGKVDFEGKKESVFNLALRKIKAIKNPKAIRWTLYNDTNIIEAMMLSEYCNANSVFVPLKTLGNATNLAYKVPNKNILNDVYSSIIGFNEIAEHNHIIQHPQYLLFRMMYEKKKNGNLIEDFRYCSVRRRICGAGCSRIFIDNNGHIKPCPFLPNFDMGNIIKDNDKKVKKNLEKFNNQMDNIKRGGKCSDCYWINICNGGCIAEFIDKNIKDGLNCPFGGRKNDNMYR